MRFGLLTIGDELLSGKVLDSNKLHIGRLADSLGGSLVVQVSTNDVLSDMADAFHFAIERCEVLIVTGGLGGTHDDLSFALVARVFAEHEAEEIPNHVGTASGWILKNGEKTLILLPGPPRENRPMLEVLKRKFLTEPICERYYQLVGLPEVEIERRLRLVLGEERTPYFATYVSDGYTTLKVRTSDVQVCHQISDTIEELFKEEIFARGRETIPTRFYSLLKERGWTLALAESATCGGIAALLAQISGMSKVLFGSYVVYTAGAKQQMLALEPSLLTGECVGEEITAAMAKAALSKSGADVALAVTGFSEHENPELHGLLHVAAASREHMEQATFKIRGNREAVLIRMRYRALAFAIQFLLKEMPQ